VGALLAQVVLMVLRTWSRRTDSTLDDLMVRNLLGPLRVLVPLVALLVTLPAIDLPADVAVVVRQMVVIGCVASGTWLALRALDIGEQWLIARYDPAKTDVVLARSVQTRVRVGRNIAVAVVLVLGVAIALTTIEPVRQLGASMLASAGVAGVVIGFAAQRSISTLFAGVQIALTEPIRIGDVVIVQGNYGTIEELTLTYVVVRIWDQRRLVVPITWFLDQPFENWTRTSSELLGTVELAVDATAPVAEIRARFEEVTDASADLWDGRTRGVQVTEYKEGGIVVRLLMSAADSGKLWDLRCRVREQMVTWLQGAHPEALARTRVELPRPDEERTTA
jgi:small-conductance mechanosensitive channel